MSRNFASGMDAASIYAYEVLPKAILSTDRQQAIIHIF